MGTPGSDGPKDTAAPLSAIQPVRSRRASYSSPGRVISAGATALVAGSAVFGKGPKSYRDAIVALRNGRG
jgi:hypothetical protein